MSEHEPSPQWVGGVEIDGPHDAIHHRTRQPLERHEQPYKHGTVWAIDASGQRAGRQTFVVYEFARVVLLEDAGMTKEDGNNGEDNTGQGGARAMLDLLELTYPGPEWWLASSERADHSQDGINFMRRRERAGRRKVHTETCALTQPRPELPCGCAFADRQAEDSALDVPDERAD